MLKGQVKKTLYLWILSDNEMMLIQTHDIITEDIISELQEKHLKAKKLKKAVAVDTPVNLKI